ncbi:MAG: hypothetical protein WBA23_06050 [Tunicatimonas sp.]|uniref:hypothetical protein n=1 Tax=Tunicatimonas sp. TaxID=1940096 RepID=UPI003C733A77
MTLTLNALDLLFELGDACLQKPEVYLQAGHNGPYRHPETPLRNKGHWLITFSRLYEWSGDEKYRRAVKDLASVFLEPQYRPHGYSFLHRNAKGKDRCNGIMGQAWSIESLAAASRTLSDPIYTKLASEVFLQHPFNDSLGLWNVLEVDGTVKPIDNAFNHQLWFAAAASFIMDSDPLIAERVHTFMDKIWDNVTLLEDGLIYHELENITEDKFQTVVVSSGLVNVWQIVSAVLQKLRLKDKPLSPEERKKLQWSKMLNKSIGYHSFNTYAFGLLKNNTLEHPLWKHPKLLSIINYLLTNNYSKGIANNRYSYAYNPPGFEIPFSLASFENDEEGNIRCSQLFLQQQLDFCYNHESKLMDRNNEDIFTLTARSYEISRSESNFLRKIIINS